MSSSTLGGREEMAMDEVEKGLEGGASEVEGQVGKVEEVNEDG